MSDDESAAAPRRLIYGRRRGRKLSPTRENRFGDWLPTLKELIPTVGMTLNDRPDEAKRVLDTTAETLQLQQ